MPDGQVAQNLARPVAEDAPGAEALHLAPAASAPWAPVAAAEPAWVPGWDLSTAAPTLGAVRRQPVSRLAPPARFRAPAVTLDAVQAGDVHVGAASVIGASHAA